MLTINSFKQIGPLPWSASTKKVDNLCIYCLFGQTLTSTYVRKDRSNLRRLEAILTCSFRIPDLLIDSSIDSKAIIEQGEIYGASHIPIDLPLTPWIKEDKSPPATVIFHATLSIGNETLAAIESTISLTKGS